jgi:hypothetical protein
MARCSRRSTRCAPLPRIPLEDPATLWQSRIRSDKRHSVAAAALPGPESRRLGDPQRRRRDRVHASPYGRRARYRRDPGAGVDRPRRRAQLRELEPKLAGPSATCCLARSQRAEGGDSGDPQDESQASYESFFGPDYVWIDWKRRPSRSIDRSGVAIRIAGAGRPRRSDRPGWRDRAVLRRACDRRRPRDGVRRRHTLDRGDGGA